MGKKHKDKRLSDERIEEIIKALKGLYAVDGDTDDGDCGEENYFCDISYGE